MKKSFLKCKNTDYELLEDLIPLLHSFRNEKIKEQTFIEPFVGTGSVFLNIEHFDYFILNDSNVHIYMLLNQIKNNPLLFIEDTKKLFISEANNAEYYKNMLKSYQQSNDFYKICQLFIYLNRHCYEPRINIEADILKKSFKYYKNPYFPEKEIMSMNQKLNQGQCQIFNHTFETIFENLEYGDVVYCSPEMESCNKECMNIDKDQERLTKLAVDASIKGSTIVIVNTYNEVTKELYKDCSEYYIRKSNKSLGGKKIVTEKIIAIYA